MLYEWTARSRGKVRNKWKRSDSFSCSGCRGWFVVTGFELPIYYQWCGSAAGAALWWQYQGCRKYQGLFPFFTVQERHCDDNIRHVEIPRPVSFLTVQERHCDGNIRNVENTKACFLSHGAGAALWWQYQECRKYQGLFPFSQCRSGTVMTISGM